MIFMQLEITGGTVLIDERDYDLVAQYKWCVDDKGYAVNTRSEHHYMHRLIANAPPGSMVDHANGDRLDNRRKNLRPATRSQNAANSWNNTNSTGYRGVHLRKDCGKYQSKVTYNRKTQHLGYFDDAEEAALAYDTAALEIWGEFAVLNFPERVRDAGLHTVPQGA